MWQSVERIQLFLCAGLWMSLHLLAPLFSSRILKGLNGSIPPRQVYSIYWNRLPAKYLPGGIWQSVTRAADMRLEGLSGSVLATLMFYEIALPPIFTAVVGGSIVYVTLAGFANSYILAALIFCALILLGFPYLASAFFLKKAEPLRYYYFFQGVLILLLYWFIAGTAFYFYLSAFVVDPQISLLQVIGAYMSSWVIGFITLIAPQGVGVMEISMTKLLNLPIAFSAAVVLFAGFRLLVLFSDLFFWLIYQVAHFISSYSALRRR